MVSIGLVILVTGGFWAFYQFNAHQPAKPKIVHLTAIGDSLTYGVGDHPGKGGYPNLIRQKVNHSTHHITMTAANFGISGETTNQINHRVVSSPKLRNNIRRADVITVTTGGNDMLHFLKANLAVQTRRDLSAKLQQYATAYQTRVSRLLTNIRRLNKRVHIFVFGIYNPVYVYFPQVSFINQAIQLNNRVTSRVVQAQSRTYFISINKKLSDGQYRTAKSREKLKQRASGIGDQTLGANQLEKLLTGQGNTSNRYLSTEDHFHPNRTGYQIMTNLLYRKMCQHLSWLKE